MKAPLHVGEAQPGVLLLPTDALQLLLSVLLCNAGTLLPLLDTLREDLVDPAVEQNAQRLRHFKTQHDIDLSFERKPHEPHGRVE